MGNLRNSLLLLLLIITQSATNISKSAEARTLPFSSLHLRSSKIFATLGVECKCCDSGECSTSWKGSCSDLKCLPWRIG
ncbi:hypothetical protein LINGRAHAP2_LOCUS12601 [Linum grandiflorum]